MGISRRDFLKGLAVAAGYAAVPGIAIGSEASTLAMQVSGGLVTGDTFTISGVMSPHGGKQVFKVVFHTEDDKSTFVVPLR